MADFERERIHVGKVPVAQVPECRMVPHHESDHASRSNPTGCLGDIEHILRAKRHRLLDVKRNSGSGKASYHLEPNVGGSCDDRAVPLAKVFGARPGEVPGEFRIGQQCAVRAEQEKILVVALSDGPRAHDQNPHRRFPDWGNIATTRAQRARTGQTAPPTESTPSLNRRNLPTSTAYCALCPVSVSCR